MSGRWLSYSSYLKALYGKPVYRISLDGGFSCPNRDPDGRGGCSFCDGTGAVASYQRSSESGFFRGSAYTESVASSLLPRLAGLSEQAEKAREFLARRYKAELFSVYFQAFTNTYAPTEDLRALYSAALDAVPGARELIVSTRPDQLGDEVLSLLSSYRTENRAVWVELGLQSADNRTLSRINRGHTAECWQDAVERAHKAGLKVSAHIILGLPGEGRDDYVRTARFVDKAAADGIKIHNLHISGGSGMAMEYREGELTAPGFERQLEDTELVLRHLSPGMVIQRLLSDTPFHRLMAPRDFPDKFIFLTRLEERMAANGTRQGDLHE